MYTGTIIDEIIKTVEQAEAHARELSAETELERWYAKHHQTFKADAKLLGVA